MDRRYQEKAPAKSAEVPTCGAVMLDGDGRIVHCDEGVTHLLGTDEIVGRPLADLLPETPGLESALGNCTSKATMAGQCRVTVEDCERVLSLGLAPLPPEKHAEARFLCLVNDVTGQQDLKKQFLQAQKMETLGRLAGGMAHNFNNMLTIMIGCADVALESIDDNSPAVKQLHRLKQAGRDAAAMVSSLMIYSRKYQPRVQNLDLGKVLDRMDQLVRRLIRGDINLVVEGPAEPVQVQIDEQLFEQVIVNLVVNACDAIEGTGEILIRALPQEDAKVGIEVCDTGEGIPEDIVDKIFDAFFTTKSAGTGLGLATCRDIIGSLGGSISVHARKGPGTRFLIELPATGEAEGEVVESARSGPRTIPADIRVLVVDDQPALRDVVASIFESRGAQVTLAADGVEALQLLQRRREDYDLVVTNHMMPEMRGGELIRNAESTWPDLHILLVSGYAVEEKVEPMDQNVGFLKKPFSADDLIAAASELMAREKRN